MATNRMSQKLTAIAQSDLSLRWSRKSYYSFFVMYWLLLPMAHTFFFVRFQATFDCLVRFCGQRYGADEGAWKAVVDVLMSKIGAAM